MRLWAISDLHLNHEANRTTLAGIAARPTDWLILAGDLGERADHLWWAFDALQSKFKQLVWVPGNHELWVAPTDLTAARGVAKYESLVQICRDYGVLTPEDPYPVWPGSGPTTTIAPLFLLYDYSFGPDGLTPDQTIAWARAGGIQCADQRFLDPAPYESRQAWCAARLAATAARLEAIPVDHQTVLINHWTLRRDLVRLTRIPHFVPWCGTRETDDWHRRFRAAVVVSGHLHLRATDWRDGTRFEEVALGYPQHWRDETGADGYLREILPGPGPRLGFTSGAPQWHR